MLSLLTRETTGVYQGALHDQASQRVADENDRTVGAVSQLYEKFRSVLEARYQTKKISKARAIKNKVENIDLHFD